tara:strand:- start:490 stop:687 length:198 start_codon:yes stop_codon:yes gene_type:complete
MKQVLQNLRRALRITRLELQEVWYENRQSALCESLLQIERNLEKALEKLGATGYKRPAFKGIRAN